jgi:hypothetical protein
VGEEKGVGCSAGVEAGVYMPESVALSSDVNVELKLEGGK